MNAFSALTLVVERQEEQLVIKKKFE